MRAGPRLNYLPLFDTKMKRKKFEAESENQSWLGREGKGEVVQEMVETYGKRLLLLRIGG